LDQDQEVRQQQITLLQNIIKLLELDKTNGQYHYD